MRFEYTMHFNMSRFKVDVSVSNVQIEQFQTLTALVQDALQADAQALLADSFPPVAIQVRVYGVLAQAGYETADVKVRA